MGTVLVTVLRTSSGVEFMRWIVDPTLPRLCDGTDLIATERCDEQP
jgi:hypothetical protein